MRFLNWLNRALVIVLLLILFITGVATAIVPRLAASVLRAIATVLDVDVFGAGHLGVAIVAIPIAVVSLVLLILEFRVRRPESVALAGDAGAQLATDTIIDRLRRDVEAVPAVLNARPTVTARRRGVDIELSVDTQPDVDVPTKAQEVRAVATQTIESLGLKLGRLSVRISQTGRGGAIRRLSGDGDPAAPGAESGNTSL